MHVSLVGSDVWWLWWCQLSRKAMHMPLANAKMGFHVPGFPSCRVLISFLQNIGNTAKQLVPACPLNFITGIGIKTNAGIIVK
jgi:hypothetical protein